MIWITTVAYGMPTLSFVNSDHVDYTKIRSDIAFQEWISTLPTIEIPTHTPNATKAFWINVYNGLTIQVVAENMPIQSIQEIDGGKVWTTRPFVVGNQMVTLDQIEKTILGSFKDPRIHAALNCAAKGCPALYEQPFTASDLDTQLDLVSKRWVNNGGFTYNDGWFTDSASANQIFDWYKEDFPCDPTKPMPKYDTTEYCGVLQFIAKYSTEYRKHIGTDYHTLSFEDYDWSLNSKP